jgi:hypothetical protein
MNEQNLLSAIAKGLVPTPCEWIKERADNARRIANGKAGADRLGWLADAAYYDAILAEIARLTAQVTELQAANTREVERRREAEAQARALTMRAFRGAANRVKGGAE